MLTRKLTNNISQYGQRKYCQNNNKIDGLLYAYASMGVFSGTIIGGHTGYNIFKEELHRDCALMGAIGGTGIGILIFLAGGLTWPVSFPSFIYDRYKGNRNPFVD